MPQHDPEDIARYVLWQLASLRADMAELKIQILELSADESQVGQIAEWKRQNTGLRRQLYLDALHEAGLPDGPIPPEVRS